MTPINWWMDVPAASTKVLDGADYRRNLFLVASPSNTEVIWLAFGWPKDDDPAVTASVWNWIPLSPWGSLNLSSDFWLISCALYAISASGTQRLSYVLN